MSPSLFSRIQARACVVSIVFMFSLGDDSGVVYIISIESYAVSLTSCTVAVGFSSRKVCFMSL